MLIVPAKLVEFQEVVPLELIGAMCSPTVGGGPAFEAIEDLFNFIALGVQSGENHFYTNSQN